jgi:pimeloyl-ACP methyl ester carboxylesterase
MRPRIVLWSEWIAARFPRRAVFLIAGTVMAITGCSTAPGRGAEVRDAQAAGFVAQTLDGGVFRLFSLLRAAPEPGPELVIYIEGDGKAWQHRNRPAADPTPRHPAALKLALADPRPAVLYLARPCQFQPHPLPEPCAMRYWTVARYSEEVLRSMDEAISSAARGYQRLVLAGHSGGGTVAVLLAARRRDVAGLITVAANLDHAAWTALHGVAPLAGSLNAADQALQVQHIPQLHLVGGQDDTVPERIVRAFTNRMTDTSRVRVRTEPGFTHDCCWEDAWPRLLGEFDAFRTPSAR